MAEIKFVEWCNFPRNRQDLTMIQQQTPLLDQICYESMMQPSHGAIKTFSIISDVHSDLST